MGLRGVEFLPEAKPLAVIPFLRRAQPKELSDPELLDLFQTDPRRAWDRFIDRYADFILSTLHHLGFDYDEAMDRFVFVCEKLSEGGYRRLCQVQFAGQRGDLTPWIRTVVRHLSISWARSVDGRRRLFKSVERLPARERRIFELYFWQGRTPSEIHEQLRAEAQDDLSLAAVLDALGKVFEHLDAHQRWRLASQLARHRPTIPVESPHPESGVVYEPPAREISPEQALLLKERQGRFESALDGLASRDRLILQLRYEEAMSLAEVAQIVRVSPSTVKNSLRASLNSLRASA